MAKNAKKSSTPKAPAHPQMEKVIAQVSDGVRPNVQAFVDWVKSLGGPEMDVEHTQIVISGYKYFQKSEAAQNYRAEVAGSREEERAARDAAREAKRAERAEKAAEEKAAKAAAKAATEAKAAKVTKGKSAAASSAPAKKATTAKKATPAKKKSGSKAKAAF